jgi:hypothetical protein
VHLRIRPLRILPQVIVLRISSAVTDLTFL